MIRAFKRLNRYLNANLSTYLANFDEIDWSVKEKPECECGILLECNDCYVRSVIKSETVLE